jgi:hypothetical protein
MQNNDARHVVDKHRDKAGRIARWRKWQIGSLALLFFFAASVQAQFRTSIQGTVIDPQGAVIPGATLTLTNKSTNETVVRTSNGEGIFNFNALPSDRFVLTVERGGFEKKVLDDLQLIPEQANSLTVQLQVGASSQTVTVNASATPAVDTETANNGQTISENDIQHMPVFQRDATGLIQTAPGVTADGSQSGGGGGFASPGTQSGASHGGGGNLGTSSSIFATENGPSANTNGGQFENNGFTVDGVSTVSAVWGGATIITPSEDSIANVRIVTNAYDAENGRFAGAMTEITSKSGSNDIHGSLFAQIVRPGLNAYQRWNGAQSVASGTPASRGLLKDTDFYNQFGGSVGGPIWKNKVFAFFNYEGQNLNSPSTGTGWYSTSALASLAPSSSLAYKYLNFTGANVLGTLIPSATCATAGLTVGVNCNNVSGGLNIGSPLTTGLGTQDPNYVDSSSPGVGSGLSTTADIAQYTTSEPKTSTFKQFNGRLDADATKNDHISFTIYWVPDTLTYYNGAFGYDLYHHSQTNNATSLIWNHTFTPSFLNEARFNAAGWRYNELSSNPQAPFGLPQDYLYASSGGKQIGGISLGGWGVGAPAIYDQWTYDYKDVATKVLRSHTMKAGFDLTRLYYLNDPLGTPSYDFLNLWDFMNDAPAIENGSFQATTGIPGGYRNDNRQNILGIFFQDDWKLRQNLTLNLGLRWSHFGPLTDKDKNMGVLLFGSGSSYLTGMSIKTGVGAWTAQKMNWGPEVGFNWAPAYLKSKLVVRGGFGLNYNGMEIANSNADDGNPPGTSGMPGNPSNPSPTNINPYILYAMSSSATNIFGYPANKNTITTFNSAGLPTMGGASLNTTENNMPTEYIEHYSLEADYDLGHSLIADLGYTGSVGRHLMNVYNANALGPLKGAALNPLVTDIETFGSGGRSTNNMMLAGLKQTFAHGFSAEAQYTWARSEDTGSGPYERTFYLYDMHLNYGRSDFDIKEAFKLFGTWQPAFVPRGNEWAGWANGFSLSGIMTFHTGYGWTPYFNQPHNFYCSVCSQWGSPSLIPKYLGTGGKSTGNKAFETGSNFANPGTINTGTNNNLFSDNYFSISDFSALITDNAGQTATTMPAPGMGRNFMPGPGYRNVDLNIGKSIHLPNSRALGENASLQIKADLLNVFNITNINPSTISTNIQSSNLGQATSALGSRYIDFQARFSF